MEFARAQMTRHYWGEFVGSLEDLGLSLGPQLLATLDCDAVRTRLCLEPHQGMEVYLAEVERSGGRLRMHPAVVIGRVQVRLGRGIVLSWQRIQLD
tara:strand:+ start:392 stop:679 length:288 start_codon:yes stop_codon:yes gene_type:complete